MAFSNSENSPSDLDAVENSFKSSRPTPAFNAATMASNGLEDVMQNRSISNFLVSLALISLIGLHTTFGLTENDLMNVDRNQNWIWNLALVVVKANDSASHGHVNSVNLAIIKRVIEASGAAHDIDNVFVPA